MVKKNYHHNRYGITSIYTDYLKKEYQSTPKDHICSYQSGWITSTWELCSQIVNIVSLYRSGVKQITIVLWYADAI